MPEVKKPIHCEFDFQLQAGDYELRTMNNESFWLSHKDGEGMQLWNSDLEEMFSQYFKENF